MYDSEFGHLPAPATTDKAGKTLLSWRVAILPYIEQGALFLQFKQDEPWDSPHNKKLLANMPPIFAPVVKTPQPNTTFYQMFVKPGTVYAADPYAKPGIPGGPRLPPGGRRERLPSFNGGFLGGPSNLFLIVEAGTPVPWTKPEDIAYDPKKPLPALGGQFKNVFHVAFGDCTVRALPKTLNETMVRFGITSAGGDPQRWDELNQPAESPVRRERLDELRIENGKLKGEAKSLTEVLGEVRTELKNLRWALEQEKMLAADPEAKTLKAENEALEKAIKEGRDEARKLVQELRELKEAMKKKAEK